MVCFVGSTIQEDIETLKILAKKLKKNAVAVDIVCFGDVSEEQINKVQTFVSTIQNEDNSHCIIVEPGEIVSDRLIGSPIIGGGAGVGPGMGEEVDDPELAAAIRASLEEAGQAQPAAQQPQQQPSIPQPQPSAQGQQEANNPHEPTEEELEALAIQMSLE
jgi:26S proteasome regulatory subunit N10